MPNDVSSRELAEEVLASPTALPHPEEMKGTVSARVGNWAEFTATGRTTPAGVISVAILMAAMLIPLAMILRGGSRR